MSDKLVKYYLQIFFKGSFNVDYTSSKNIIIVDNLGLFLPSFVLVILSKCYMCWTNLFFIPFLRCAYHYFLILCFFNLFSFYFRVLAKCCIWWETFLLLCLCILICPLGTKARDIWVNEWHNPKFRDTWHLFTEAAHTKEETLLV